MSRSSARSTLVLLAVLAATPALAGAAELRLTGPGGQTSLTVAPGDVVTLEVSVSSDARDIAALEGILDVQERSPDTAPLPSGVPSSPTDPKAAKVQAGPLFSAPEAVLIALGSLFGPGQVKFAIAYLAASGSTANGPGTVAVIPLRIPETASPGATYTARLLNVTLKSSLNADIPVTTRNALITVGSPLPPPGDSGVLSVTDSLGNSHIAATAGQLLDLQLRVDGGVQDLGALEVVLDFTQKSPSSAPDVTGKPSGQAISTQIGPMFTLAGATLATTLGNQVSPGRLKVVVAYLNLHSPANGPGTVVTVPVQIPALAAGATYSVRLTDPVVKTSDNQDISVSAVGATIEVSGGAGPAKTRLAVTDSAGGSRIAGKAGETVDVVVRVDAAAQDVGAAELTLDLTQKTPSDAPDLTGESQGSGAKAILGSIFTPSGAVLATALGNQLAPGRLKATIAYLNTSSPANGPGSLVVLPVRIPASATVGTRYTARLSDVILKTSANLEVPFTLSEATVEVTDGAVPPPPVTVPGSLVVTDASGSQDISAQPGQWVNLEVRVSDAARDISAAEFVLDLTRKSPAAVPDITGKVSGQAIEARLGTVFNPVGALFATAMGNQIAAGQMKLVLAYINFDTPGNGPGSLIIVPVKIPDNAPVGSTYAVKLSGVTLQDSAGKPILVDPGTSLITVRSVPADNTPPSVTIRVPAADALVPGDLAIKVEAADDLSGVAKVGVSVQQGGFESEAAALPFDFILRKGTLKDGKYTLVARATDKAGNQADSNAVPFTVDTEGPRLSLSGVAAGSFIRNSVTLKVSATDALAGVAKVSLYLDKSSTPLQELVPTSGQTAFEFTVDTKGLTVGQHLLRVVGADKAGNTSAAEVAAVVDNVPPMAVVTSPQPSAQVKGIVPVLGTAAEPDATGSGLASYVLEYGEGASPASFTAIRSAAAPVTQNELGRWDTTKLKMGDYTLRLTVTDRAGNVVRTSVLVTVRNLLPGDLDGSGALTVMDVVQLLRVVAGINKNPTPDQLAASDVDQNGRTDIRDVAKLVRIVARLE